MLFSEIERLLLLSCILVAAVIVYQGVTTSIYFLQNNSGRIQVESRTRSAQTVEGQSVPLLSGERCIIYDKPPRTKSSNISLLLQRCMFKNNVPYAKVNFERESDYKLRVLPEFFALKASNQIRSLVSQHFYATKEDMRNVVSRCQHLMYITSASPVKARLIARVKMFTRATSGQEPDAAEILTAAERMESQFARLEEEHERYPYLANLSETIREEDRIQPDYVIRTSHLSSDLHSLLSALGCLGSPHKMEDSAVSAQLSEIRSTSRPSSLDVPEGLGTMFDRDHYQIRYDDHRYKFLAKLAEEQNKEGLEKARRIVSHVS